jgi:hypothetical protein
MLTFNKGSNTSAYFINWLVLRPYKRKRTERQKSIVIRLKVSQFISGIAGDKVNFVSLSVHKSALKNEHQNNLFNLELINSYNSINRQA